VLQGQSTTTIVIVDDHPLFRGALRQAIGSLLPQSRVVEADGLDELTATLSAEKDVDLILLDLTMPGVQGFSGLIALRAQHPSVPVVIVSATEEASVIRNAMGFGASGFIPKSMNIATIGAAIEAVLGGDQWTPPDIDLTAAEDKETADLVRRVGRSRPSRSAS
jgi:DNA-binding NarL/FixJ family response regulator